jgi:hypothetical protein
LGEQLGCHSGAGRNPEYVVLSPKMNWTLACAGMTKLPVLGLKDWIPDNCLGNDKIVFLQDAQSILNFGLMRRG